MTDSWACRLMDVAMVNIAGAPVEYPSRWGNRWLRVLGVVVAPLWAMVTAPVWIPLFFVGGGCEVVMMAWRGDL